MTIDKLTFQKESNDFVAYFSIADNQHSMTLCDFSEKQEAQAEVLANKILKWLETNLDKSKLFAATELIELKNETWLEEDEEPINESKFVGMIKFSDVTAFADGNFEIYFDDSDIFWGHLIRVDVDEDFKFNSADIAG